MLRCANVLGPDVETGFTRMLGLPMVPMVLGFDPRLQFVHEDDVVHALEHAALNGSPGTFNVAADGVAGALRGDLAGRPPAAAAAAAVRRWRCSPGRCGGSGFRTPDEMANLLRFGRGVDNRLLKATGFDYGFTSRETLIRLGEHMRLEPILRGRGDRGELSVRARGRGVPALEPARAPRALPARASRPTATRSASEPATDAGHAGLSYCRANLNRRLHRW